MVIRATELFSSLSNEIRLRALMLLVDAGELCVCDLTEAMQVPQPQMSRQLGLLREAGLVESRRAGHWVHYCLNPDLPEWANEVLAQVAHGIVGTRPFVQDARRLGVSLGRKEQSHCS